MYTMCPPGCYHNGFMATPELGHRMYGSYICIGVPMYGIMAFLRNVIRIQRKSMALSLNVLIYHIRNFKTE